MNRGAALRPHLFAFAGPAIAYWSCRRGQVQVAQQANLYPPGVRSGKPVTNQVTTAPGNGRQSTTYSDTRNPLASGNPT
jgi:hypothetical protein